MKNTTNKDGWSSECPTTPGMYELKRGHHVEMTTIEHYPESDRLLVITRLSRYPLKEWHKAMKDPQWRPARAASKTPETDAACLNVDNWNSVVPADFARSLETRLADAEKRIKDDEERVREWRDYSESHGREIATLLAERDAWKALAGKLGDAASWAIKGKSSQSYDNFQDQEQYWGAVEALAELEKLKE